MKRFDHVVEILDTAINHQPNISGPHGTFWRGKTLAQFIGLTVVGRTLVEPGNSTDSNLIKALRGLDPFGADLPSPPANAILRRMPAGRPPVAADAIDFIAQWIDDGCPDDEMPSPLLQRLLAVHAIRPPPVDLFTPDAFNSFFRDFDDFFQNHASADTRAAVGTFQSLALGLWPGSAQNPDLNAWIAKINEPNAKSAIQYLSDNQIRIFVKFFGNPEDQRALNEAFWQFGKGTLPPDDLRPGDPHRMDFTLQWLIWLACADASLRLGMRRALWEQTAKAVALGLVGDALFQPLRVPKLKITRYTAQDPNVQNKVATDFAKLTGNDLLDAMISIGREARFGTP